MKVKREQLLVASILHDVGKSKLKPSKLFQQKGFRKDILIEWRKHAELSAPIAKNYLKRKGHSDEFIEDVTFLIRNHDKRDLKNKSIELKILQDADLIADIGLAGFTRPFLFAGKFSRSIIQTINYLQNEDRTNNLKSLNLKETKELAREKLNEQKKLAKQILKDLNSDLIN